MTRMLAVNPRWPPGRRRAELSALFVFLLLGCPATAICPSRCVCNDKILEAHCRQSNLEVVPIQLNPDVRSLSLTHNRISNIHLSFSFYTSLTDLDLAQNKIRNLGARNFEFQFDLLRLNLSFNAIKELHKDAFKGLTNLMVLDLSGNVMEEIVEPMAFRDLHNLHVLDLSQNSLLSIGVGAFDYLIDLRRLLLHGNQLLSVPESSINTLGRLEELNLNLNLIQEVSLPNNMDSLLILRLRSNVIASLNNESLQFTTNLRHLDLSDNNFTSVPTLEMSKLANLEILNLSCNLFKHLGPNSFRNLYKLTEIYLDDMGALNIVDSKAFSDNLNLQVVSLARNHGLRHFPKHLLAHKNHLKHVSLNGNAFSTLDASDLPLDQLETLRLGGNPFHCNCSLLWLWILKERQMRSNCSEACLEPRPEKHVAEEYSDEYGSVEESAVFQSYTHATHLLPMILDLDEVTCEAAERGKIPLREVPKTTFDCTVTWVLVLSIVVLITLSLFLVLITTYIIKIRVKKKSRNPVESFLSATKTYEDTHHTYYRYSGEKAPPEGFPDPFKVKCMSNMYMKSSDPFGTFKHHTGSLRPSYCNTMDTSRHFVSEANIYQEPYAGPILAPTQRPHIVYV